MGHLQWQKNDALDYWADSDIVNARSTAAYVISERITRELTPGSERHSRERPNLDLLRAGLFTLGQSLSVDPDLHLLRNGNYTKLDRRPCPHHASRDDINYGSSFPSSRSWEEAGSLSRDGIVASSNVILQTDPCGKRSICGLRSTEAPSGG